MSVSCPLSTGRRRRSAAPCLPCRHARTHTRLGACTVCSESIRVLGLLGGLRPGPACRSAAPVLRPAGGVPNRPTPSRVSTPLGTGLRGPSAVCVRCPSARGAALSRLRRPAAASLSISCIGWCGQLATHSPSVGPAVSTPCSTVGSRAVSHASRHKPVLAHVPYVAPAVSTACWLTGRCTRC